MNLKDFLDIAWHVLIEDGFSVAWRVGLSAILAAPVGLVLLLLCYRFFYRNNLLKLKLRHERFFEWTVLAIWIFAIPTITISCGTLAGVWWAGNHVVKSNQLGERIGKSAFQAVAAGLAAAGSEDNPNQQLRLAQSLLKGEQKVRISEISQFTSHNAGELSARQLEALLPMESEWLRKTTAWAVEKSLDTIALYQLGKEGDLAYKLVAKVTEHDRRTDNDGYVTVEEISNVACEAFLDRGVMHLWAALVLEFLLPVFFLLLLFPIAPPLLAWSIRRLVSWRASRAV